VVYALPVEGANPLAIHVRSIPCCLLALEQRASLVPAASAWHINQKYVYFLMS
jgi:hypothetical protein